MKSNILDSDFVESWNFSGCPSAAVLSSFLHDELESAMSDEINAHCVFCRKCQAVCDAITEKEHKEVRKRLNRKK